MPKRDVFFFCIRADKIPKIKFTWASIIPVIPCVGFFLGYTNNTNFPLSEFGGHSEANENIFETALREYSEESYDLLQKFTVDDLLNSIAIITIPEDKFNLLEPKDEEIISEYFIGVAKYPKLGSRELNNISAHFFVILKEKYYDIREINKMFTKKFHENTSKSYMTEMRGITYIPFKQIKKYYNEYKKNFYYSIRTKFFIQSLLSFGSFPYMY